MDYHKEYYKLNKTKIGRLCREWKTINRELWNEYQSRWRRIKYWEAKVAKDPNNEEWKAKLEYEKTSPYPKNGTGSFST